ncbi:hypothetical protein [Paenimyroides baculatum]|uniref:Uncharacterized protein n=1 Tax=Paenimyroides baculatum TaxID=2608000 RepID=A0A5M6CSJ3_9FLAO|nr:hypothetical protein [Paenimyroides baculatum]KAA5536015.1 hypothetical protein F0460_06200 [Paenimyroides baculatum]
MKKLICCVIGLTGLFASAQETRVKSEKPEQSVYAVEVKLIGSNTGLMTVSGNSTMNDLKEIEKTAQDHGISISFVNQKFNRNQLEYIELLFQNNGKWETLTFGTDDLRLLPFSISFSTDKKEGKETRKFSIKNNKNNRSGTSSDNVYQII